MPPGTGDTQLTISQTIPIDGNNRDISFCEAAWFKHCRTNFSTASNNVLKYSNINNINMYCMYHSTLNFNNTVTDF